PVSYVTDGLAGRNRYRVILDPDRVHDDRNRNNNSAETVLVLQGLPDLVVPAFVLLETPTPAQGQPLTVRALIGNLGTASARALSVEVFAGEPDNGGFPIGQTTIDSLAALSDTIVDIPVDTSQLAGALD